MDLVAFRIAPKEKEALQRAADAAGLGVSPFIIETLKKAGIL